MKNAKKKMNGDTLEQLKNLDLWSRNPVAYEKKLKEFVESENPVPRHAKEKKQIKLAKKQLPKDWKPKYLNGNIIDLKPLIHDPWWLIKPEKPEDDTPDDDTRNRPTLEEKINQIAYQRKLAENKLLGLNEEFAKQKLRERMS